MHAFVPRNPVRRVATGGGSEAAPAMRRTRHGKEYEMLRSTLIAALATPLIMQGAVAQEAEDEAGQDTGEVIVAEQEGSEVRGDWVLGSRVYTPDGVTIGSIEDLIIDQEDGSVNAAVISVGGFLGFGAKQIAVDWSELQLDYDGNEVTLGITREEAEEAPEYAFRPQEEPPAPEMDTGTGTGTVGTGTGGTGMGVPN